MFHRINSLLSIILCFPLTSWCKHVSGEIGVENLEEVFAWKQISYDLSKTTDLGDSEPFTGDDHFDIYNNLPMGVDRWRNKLFITVPRRRLGIPSTLNYVDLNESPKNKSPSLIPYPDIKTNTLTSEKPLVNVYRTRVDVCDRLWVIDTGFYHVPRHFKEMQPASIVIFDLKTDTVINRYELANVRDYTCEDKAGLISLTIDVDKNDCDNAFAYIADVHNCRMAVYSLKQNMSWSFVHNYFKLDPEESNYNVGGFRFQWDDCLYSIALGPKMNDGYRTAYFHSMSSYRERIVSTRVLRNRTLSLRFSHGDDLEALGNRGPYSQTAMHGIDVESEIMVSGQTGNSALTCWNINKPFTSENIGIVAQDSKKFMWPSDLKIDHEKNVWVMTNNLPIFVYSKLNTEGINYRVYRIPISKIKNTTEICS